jgi:uncharacterized OB-fold protein
MSAPAEYLKPLPHPSPDSQPFWDACQRHSLEMQKCSSCGQFWFPPGNRCSHCLSPEYSWKPLTGRGSVVTFTVMRRAYQSGFANELPYTVAVVELAEGPRMISNVIDCDPDAVTVGMPVEVVFRDCTDEATLPLFRPV